MNRKSYRLSRIFSKRGNARIIINGCSHSVLFGFYAIFGATLSFRDKKRMLNTSISSGKIFLPEKISWMLCFMKHHG